MDTATALRTARKVARLSQRELARRERAFAAYQNLPEENDAWATGVLAQSGITSGSEEPVPAEQPDSFWIDGGVPPQRHHLGGRKRRF